MSNLINSIKKHEGFRGMPYEDTLGYQTIGYGTKLPINEAEATLLLRYRLDRMIAELIEQKPIVMQLPEDKQDVIYETCYQLGVGGVLKFKNMWSALESFDYELAAKEMKDSKWYRQTPNRVEELASRMSK